MSVSYTHLLAASIVNAVRLSAAAGAFSLADVQNLLANALVLEQGVAGSMTIANLAVTNANLLSATVGKLILPGTDGNYYELYIGAGGAVHAAEVELTDAEIAAGQTESGRPVASTQINAGWISGQTVQANEALFGEILAGALNAGQITAAEAMIASACLLYTSAIAVLHKIAADNHGYICPDKEGTHFILIRKHGTHIDPCQKAGIAFHDLSLRHVLCKPVIDHGEILPDICSQLIQPFL